MFDPYASTPHPKTVEIVPAVLPKSLSDLEAHAVQIVGAAKRIQVDIVDGVYAHGSFGHAATWPYHDTKTFTKIVSEEHGLPKWDEINYEFDLMINNPLEKVVEYVRAGASHLLIHARSPGAADAVQKLLEMREDGGAFTVKVGVALMPDAQPEDLLAFEAYDYVQVMGIVNIGKQGQPFDMHALHLVERLHDRYPELLLQVDGGVNKETIPQLVKAGANVLIAGSAVFGADVPATAVAELTKLANGIL